MLKFHPLKVLSVAPEAADAIQIALEVPDALKEEYSGAPGQHIVVCARRGEGQMRRTYSLVNAPGEWPLRIVPRVLPAAGACRLTWQKSCVAGADTSRCCRRTAASRPAPRRRGHLRRVCRRLWHHPGAVGGARAASGNAARVLLFYGNSSTARAMCLEELLALKDRHLGAPRRCISS